MTPSGIVTLLTDFGTRDPFVGVMKGVILSREAELRMVDLTHDLEPHAVADAAFWIAQAFSWFPAGTVHLAVVDPGVGGARAAVAVQADEHLFVGPDNGIFEVVVRRAKSAEIRRLAPERLRLQTPSRTFHGRDVFAPVAAMLAAGTRAFADIGPLVALSPSRLVPEPELAADGARGVVAVVDHFGNLITNLPEAMVSADETARIRVGGRRLALVRAYSEAPLGEPAAIVGSFGTVEIFVREGSAAVVLGAGRGAAVSVGP